jgi:hypothetical protein
MWARVMKQARLKDSEKKAKEDLIKKKEAAKEKGLRRIKNRQVLFERRKKMGRV